MPEEKEVYYCELHDEQCTVDEGGAGSCGDYNRGGNCLWSTELNKD